MAHVQTGKRAFRLVSALLLLFILLILLSPNGTAQGNVVDAYIDPAEPYAGETISVYSRLDDLTNVTAIQTQYCTVDPETMEVGVCYFVPAEDIGNKTFLSNITEVFDGGTMLGYKIIVQYDDQTLEYYPEHNYFYFNITGAVIPPVDTEIPIEVIIVEVVLGIFVGLLVAILIYRNVKDVKTGSNKTLIVGIVVVLIIAVLYAALSMGTIGGEVEQVEEIHLTDIYGNQWNLSDHSGKVVVLDFMAISCPPCEVVRQSLEPAAEDFTEDELEVISIAVGLDTDLELQNYKNERGVEWTIAKDTDELATRFGVAHLPKVVVINKDGYATFETFDDVGTSKFKSEIDAALEGTATPISIAQISIFATGAFMGIATYFSPCSFPMLPGYVSFYLSTEVSQKKKSFGTVLASGLISGSGIVLVFLIIGMIAIGLGEAANLADYMIYMGPIVGGILIFLGALMFTNLQYHALVKPFQKVKVAIFGEKPPGTESKSGYYTKLFSYGVGYGAAASACTAPLFIALLLAGIVAGSFLDGVIMLIIFSLTILLLMVAITVLLSSFGQESVQKMAAHTDTIKKVSGLILVIVGAYLIFYYYTTFA